MRLLARWFALLPAAQLREQPLLQAMRLWAVAYSQGAAEATELMSATGLDAAQMPEVQAYVLPLRPLLPAMLDDIESAHRVGQQCVAQLPTASPFADALLLSTVASIQANVGDFVGARRYLESARCVRGAPAGGFALMFSEAVEGLIALHEGRLREARARFKIALGGSQRAVRGGTNQNAWAGVLLAGTLYEANELDAAEHLLRAYEPVVRGLGLADLMILNALPLARIAFQRGDVDTALQTLTDLEYTGRQRQLMRVVAAAKLERSRILLLQGHAAAAADELERAGDKALWDRVAGLRLAANEVETLTLARYRWDVMAGDAERCLLPLERAAKQATAAARHLRAMKLRMLHAVALARCGRQQASQAVAGPLLEQAGAEGFLRCLVDEGAPVAAVVRARMPALLRGDAPCNDPAHVEYLRRLLDAFGAAAADSPGTAAPGAVLAEPLTRKEIGVLLLVADGYSDTAMAEKLFVSITTVRSHLRNIYAKLAVHNRTQAVAASRRAGVI